ncbi:hypothetical protein K3725_12980 [Leisingera sp. S132]|uniref:hypothetical protein n=1 Tax=Leisingera sp. S132 TaxID=2867016 RepID=UPI0021A7B03C|nr:hypothetical protein [Leisingera sp. S132]UWQ78225.1 hypothetical protein K3725_12980 [Leisingera sp. S132]
MQHLAAAAALPDTGLALRSLPTSSRQSRLRLLLFLQNHGAQWLCLSLSRQISGPGQPHARIRAASPANPQTTRTRERRCSIASKTGKPDF